MSSTSSTSWTRPLGRWPQSARSGKGATSLPRSARAGRDRGSGPAPICPLRPEASRTGDEDRADAAVLLLLEHLVSLRSLLQAHDVRRQVLGAHLVTAHQLEDVRDVAVAVLLGAAEGQRLVHHGSQGELVHEAAEDAE